MKFTKLLFTASAVLLALTLAASTGWAPQKKGPDALTASTTTETV